MSAEAGPRRLHPLIPIVSLIKQIPGMLVPLAGAVAVARGGGYGMVVLAAAGVLTLVLVFQIASWWRFTYTLLPHEMYIESGILARNRRSIPWDRVQDVEIERGLLARIFGLAKVKLETGGAGGDEGLLDSISLSDALALRDEIRARRGITVAPSGEAEAAAPPLFEMGPRRILQAGLLNFSVVWVAVTYGVYEFFDDLLPLPSRKDIEKWIGVHQEEILGYVSPATILLAIVLFLVLGTVAGVIQMFVRNYGFMLFLDGRTLRRIRGLLTRSEIAIPLRRIQAARTITNWLVRRYGMCRVDVQTMAGATTGGVQELAPLANPDEAAHLLTIAGRFARIAPEHFIPVAPAHRWYDVQVWSLPMALVLLVAGFVWPPLWWGVALAALLAALQAIMARPHGWRVEGGTLHVRRGWFGQEHWLLPIANIQSITLSISPVQRRRSLATVTVDSAGAQSGGLSIRNLATDDARALVELLRPSTHRPAAQARSIGYNGAHVPDPPPLAP